VKLAELSVGPEPVLSVGVNGANLLALGEDLAHLSRAGVRVLHVDVMDGVFCPQMTHGPSLVAALPHEFVIDAHLMIEEPLTKVDAYLAAGARILTVHPEASRHPHRVLQRLPAQEVVRGVALNPGTPISALEPLLDELDYVLILAVNPGWSGQAFIDTTVARLQQARDLIAGREIALGIDGGVTRANAAWVASLAPNVIVAGSAVFAGGDLTDNARFMLEATGSAFRIQSPPNLAAMAMRKEEGEIDG
jgi:ribulose-phosphate 3-epimerase